MVDQSDQVELQMPTLKAGKPEISMAPLIDVVFLLLIFFMVTTVFPENRGMEIEKLESKFSEPLQMKRLIFILQQDGAVFYQSKAVALLDVERLVREQLAASADTAVMLQVDKRATTQALIALMDACKLAGAKRVGIASEPIK
ncbi:MAG: biopolymer transporter ExbD [Mariprofundaceae bacterium]